MSIYFNIYFKIIIIIYNILAYYCSPILKEVDKYFLQKNNVIPMYTTNPF